MSVDEIIIQMKATGLYFPLELFTLLFWVDQTIFFLSVL